MSNDTKFIGGLIVKAPNERAPEYVKAKLSIRRAEMIAWLQSETGEWINADIKVSQGGKWYAAVDDWKPEGKQERPQQSRPQRSESRPPPPSDAFQDDDFPPF